MGYVGSIPASYPMENIKWNVVAWTSKMTVNNTPWNLQVSPSGETYRWEVYTHLDVARAWGCCKTEQEAKERAQAAVTALSGIL